MVMFSISNAHFKRIFLTRLSTYDAGTIYLYIIYWVLFGKKKKKSVDL